VSLWGMVGEMLMGLEGSEVVRVGKESGFDDCVVL